MGGENHCVAGLEGKHRIAHRRNNGVGDRAHGRDNPHRLGNQHEVGFLIFSDDPTRLFAFEVIPDDPSLALCFRDLVLVNAEARLLVSRLGYRLGIVVHILAEIPDDRVDLFLRKGFECRLGDSSVRHKLLNVAWFRRAGFFETAAHGVLCGWTYHRCRSSLFRRLRGMAWTTDRSRSATGEPVAD